jgi:hypothetical protein
MVQLSATRCSCIAILWVSLVSFAAITLCVASQQVFIVVVYVVIVSVRKLLDTPSYIGDDCHLRGRKWCCFAWSYYPLTFLDEETTASRTALGPTQPSIQWLPGALSLRVKRPGREANNSPPSSTEVKECVELYLYSPQYAFMAWCSVKKEQHRDKFTFSLPYLWQT